MRATPHLQTCEPTAVRARGLASVPLPQLRANSTCVTVAPAPCGAPCSRGA
jgi:hypothetical protein